MREYTTSELAQIQPLGTIREFRGEVTVDVVREDLATALQVCRDELHFEQCAGACAIHYPDDKDAELHVVYPLLSMTYNRRLRVETTAPDWNPRLPSGVAVYPTLDWHEREAWDMFGIVFDGHPTLTRILMPDDWAGHPQRKDYPLGGVPVQYRGATVPPPDQRRPFR